MKRDIYLEQAESNLGVERMAKSALQALSGPMAGLKADYLWSKHSVCHIMKRFGRPHSYTVQHCVLLTRESTTT